MDEAVRYAGVPYREQKKRGLDKQFDRGFPRYAIVAPMISYVSSRTMSAGDDTDARLAGVRTLLALAAYRDRFGSYPPSLSALEKRLGWRLPKDPYSGKELIYRQKSKGFLLYSVGVNLKDDKARSVSNVNVPEGYEYFNSKSRRFADMIWDFSK